MHLRQPGHGPVESEDLIGHVLSPTRARIEKFGRQRLGQADQFHAALVENVDQRDESPRLDIAKREEEVGGGRGEEVGQRRAGKQRHASFPQQVPGCLMSWQEHKHLNTDSSCCTAHLPKGWPRTPNLTLFSTKQGVAYLLARVRARVRAVPTREGRKEGAEERTSDPGSPERRLMRRALYLKQQRVGVEKNEKSVKRGGGHLSLTTTTIDTQIVPVNARWHTSFFT